MRWQTRDGRHELRIDIELITERRINADGDSLVVPACEIVETAWIDDAPEAGCLTPLAEPINGAVARWGRIGLDAERLAEYRALRAAVESTPEYQTHMAEIERGRRDSDEYIAHAARMRRAMAK